MLLVGGLRASKMQLGRAGISGGLAYTAVQHVCAACCLPEREQ
jgi:hypothetical protein